MGFVVEWWSVGWVARTYLVLHPQRQVGRRRGDGRRGRVGPHAGEYGRVMEGGRGRQRVDARGGGAGEVRVGLGVGVVGLGMGVTGLVVVHGSPGWFAWGA